MRVAAVPSTRKGLSPSRYCSEFTSAFDGSADMAAGSTVVNDPEGGIWLDLLDTAPASFGALLELVPRKGEPNAADCRRRFCVIA
jgi:hypothetical protein